MVLVKFFKVCAKGVDVSWAVIAIEQVFDGFVFFEFSTDYEGFDSLYVGLMTCDYSIL